VEGKTGLKRKALRALATRGKIAREGGGKLQPGVSSGLASDQPYVGVSNLNGFINAVSFSINGARDSQNNWTLDGADNVDRGSNQTLLTFPSIDSIAEFKVLRGPVSGFKPMDGKLLEFAEAWIEGNLYQRGAVSPVPLNFAVRRNISQDGVR
jgi:hypothetical protein